MDLKLCIVVFLLFHCSISSAMDFYSGNQYTFSTPYNEDYIYQWSATSSSSYQEINKNTIIWTAPDVDSPTEIMISVLITNKTCKCYLNLYKIIILMPNKISKQKNEFILNKTNSIPIEEPDTSSSSSDFVQSDDEIDAIALINGSNATAANPAKIIALNLYNSSQSSSDQIGEAIDQVKSNEISSGEESTGKQVDEGDTNDSCKDIQLIFDDGTEIVMAFVESRPGIYAANEVTVDNGDESALEGGTSSMENNTQLSESDLNQTLVGANQTENKALASIAVDGTDFQADSPQLQQSTAELAGNRLSPAEGPSDLSGIGAPFSDNPSSMSEQASDQSGSTTDSADREVAEAPSNDIPGIHPDPLE
jgi:hypothetical protein